MIVTELELLTTKKQAKEWTERIGWESDLALMDNLGLHSEELVHLWVAKDPFGNADDMDELTPIGRLGVALVDLDSYETKFLQCYKTTDGNIVALTEDMET